MSCGGWVFRGIFQDMGASCDVCNLQNDLADAVKACENSAGCRHRFTLEEAKKIVIEREGGHPVIPREKPEPSRDIDPQPFESLKDAFGKIAESARIALNNLAGISKELIGKRKCANCGRYGKGDEHCNLCIRAFDNVRGVESDPSYWIPAESEDAE